MRIQKGEGGGEFYYFYIHAGYHYWVMGLALQRLLLTSGQRHLIAFHSGSRLLWVMMTEELFNPLISHLEWWTVDLDMVVMQYSIVVCYLDSTATLLVRSCLCLSLSGGSSNPYFLNDGDYRSSLRAEYHVLVIVGWRNWRVGINWRRHEDGINLRSFISALTGKQNSITSFEPHVIVFTCLG